MWEGLHCGAEDAGGVDEAMGEGSGGEGDGFGTFCAGGESGRGEQDAGRIYREVDNVLVEMRCDRLGRETVTIWASQVLLDRVEHARNIL